MREKKTKHRHEYSVEASSNNGHTHIITGITTTTNGGIDTHVHYFKGITTAADGHVHRFQGVTGPAIPLPDGGHTHELLGATTLDNMHAHYYHRKIKEVL